MNKGLIASIIGTIIIISSFIWWASASQNEGLTYFRNTEIACLSNGHQRVVEHIHPELVITVDGEREEIPADVGIDEGCMSEVHTHDNTGVLHLESFLPGRIDNFNLSHFFLVWEKDYQREGYDLEVIQDGEVKSSVEDVPFIDHSIIELRYTSQNQ